jgi:hypothetical protein
MRLSFTPFAGTFGGVYTPARERGARREVTG